MTLIIYFCQQGCDVQLIRAYSQSPGCRSWGDLEGGFASVEGSGNDTFPSGCPPSRRKLAGSGSVSVYVVTTFIMVRKGGEKASGRGPGILLRLPPRYTICSGSHQYPGATSKPQSRNGVVVLGNENS